MRNLINRLFNKTGTRALDAAGSGRRWESAQSINGLNATILAGANTAARRAGWYARNNPWITAAVDSLVGNVVGAGIKPQSSHPDRRAPQDGDAGGWGMARDRQITGPAFNRFPHLGALFTDWLEKLAAQGSEDMLRAARNTLLGETWVESGEAPEWQRLAERREGFGEAQVAPAPVSVEMRHGVVWTCRGIAPLLKAPIVSNRKTTIGTKQTAEFQPEAVPS